MVEGAGGVMVPINDTQLMTDLMRHLKLPVLLVARTALGTINHTLLALAALRSASLEVRGVIMVGKPQRENRQAIEHYGATPVLGTVPVLTRIDHKVLLEVFHRSFGQHSFCQ
jgi:dethiobiotin synthetase